MDLIYYHTRLIIYGLLHGIILQKWRGESYVPGCSRHIDIQPSQEVFLFEWHTWNSISISIRCRCGRIWDLKMSEWLGISILDSSPIVSFHLHPPSFPAAAASVKLRWPNSPSLDGQVSGIVRPKKNEEKYNDLRLQSSKTTCPLTIILRLNKFCPVKCSTPPRIKSAHIDGFFVPLA